MSHNGIELLEMMLRARRFDEKLLAHSDQIRGHYHVSIGVEATSAALAAVKGDNDLVSTTYRNFSTAGTICVRT